jgi:uncharacterized protein YqjF (DUF2071 family)
MPPEFLAHTEHRPYPLPQRPWVMFQAWNTLLFAHWSVAPEVLRPRVPPSLQIDTFEGQTWIGVVPFYMNDVRARGLPPVPGTSAFCELNVRIYVTDGEKPGVWFFSLEAENPLAVWGARCFFRLPYFNARMEHKRDGDTVRYTSQRTHRGAPPAEFAGRYRPTGPVYRSVPGTLDHWLTERYCLYTADQRGRVYRSDIHHLQWPLQPAEAEIKRSTMTEAAGIQLPDAPPLLHYVERIEMVAWYLKPA